MPAGIPETCHQSARLLGPSRPRWGIRVPTPLGQLAPPTLKDFPRPCRLITFRVRRSEREMYIGHGRLCACLTVPRHIPTLLHGPGFLLGNGRGCPLVVYYWADLQSVHGFRCYDNAHVCKLIALYSANACSAEREMSASAYTCCMAGHTLVCERISYHLTDKNSSGDEIANVNFLRQHRTCRGQRLRPFNEFVICTKRLRQKRYTLPTCLEMDSPVQSASHNKWTRPSVKESHQT